MEDKIVVYIKKVESKKNASACGRELLALGLWQLYGLHLAEECVEKTSKGKPFLKGKEHICFNISHSGEYAACAFSGEPVGLDIQKYQDLSVERMARRFFSKEEQERIRKSKDPKSTFFEIWTEEESYGKWKGTGLAGTIGAGKKEGWCTHFQPEAEYAGAVWSGKKMQLDLRKKE